MRTTLPRNPYPGLRPFREDEQYLYFGREAAVDAMVDRLCSRRFLAVLGSSGSGKSSLINCGLRPALHRGLMAEAGSAWRIAVCRPGADPFAALARALDLRGVLFDMPAAAAPSAALPRAALIETTLRMSGLGLIDIVEQARLREGVNVLVIVDQFEELFRYRGLTAGGRAEDDAAAFVDLLLNARSQSALSIYVAISMRSDFLGDCTLYPGLAQTINESQYLVPRMTRDERRAAILGPIGVSGGEINPALLTRLVNDVGDDLDQLSILQHALNRTWSYWQRETGGTGEIELRHYEAIGTLAHALDQHAEERWSCLAGDRDREVCMRLFKALTDQVTDPRGVRRPAQLSALCAVIHAEPEEVRSVIEIFRDPSCSFLVPPVPEPLGSETVIDVSHESLMRVWARLRTWLMDEARSEERRVGKEC